MGVLYALARGALVRDALVRSIAVVQGQQMLLSVQAADAGRLHGHAGVVEQVEGAVAEVRQLRWPFTLGGERAGDAARRPQQRPYRLDGAGRRDYRKEVDVVAVLVHRPGVADGGYAVDAQRVAGG